ncbi:MAG TPA: hypothetical protein VGM41_00735 [Chitinophagaceae bacterium]
MYAYDTLSEAVNDMKRRGYNIDFNIEENKLVCKTTPLVLRPDEFEITEVYRFEGNTDPADEAVVYGIESKHGEKGVLVNGYGPDADAMSSDMIKKLAIRH